MVHEVESIQSEKVFSRIAAALTNFQRTSECAFDFRSGPPFKQNACLAEAHLERQLALNPLSIVRQFLEQGYRRDKIAGRICGSTALQRLLARTPEIFDSLGEVVAAAVMTRQLADMIVQLIRKHRL